MSFDNDFRDDRWFCGRDDCYGDFRERNRMRNHVHEFLGSTSINDNRPHNHRFAGISGRAIPWGRSHVHEITTRTDSTDGHFHFIRDVSGEAINVGNGRHIHFVRGLTSFDDGHRHRYIFGTLIENPIDFRDFDWD